ncbi:MAG: hypothetical protein GX128_08900 [Bacteroidales bacterium]|nr:hypothetical protein [Bacteroidales bacterium]
MKKSILTIVLMFAALFCVAQNNAIVVTSVQQRGDGSGLVDIFFNLTGPTSTYYNININVSFNGGSTYTPIEPGFLSGSIVGINPGNNKYVVWDGLGSFPNTYSTQTRLKLIATAEIAGGIPCPGMPTFTDPRDGQTYNTVQIGDQCWMKGNLNYNADNSYCYGYDPLNCAAYGRLYTWNAALTVCPVGWHLPSDNEWSQLVYYVVLQGYPNSSTTNGAGNALKSCRQVNSPLGGDCATSEHPRWNSHITYHGFDEFGFSALPGGYRNSNGSFSNIGNDGHWWSSNENSSTTAWDRNMYCNNGYVYRSNHGKADGYSVRCLRD